MARRRSTKRRSGGLKGRAKMRAGTCKRVKGGRWLCKSKRGKVAFSRTKKY